ncbi:MAG: lysophospholipid acyltransferase family protein [Eubacteriales bacterium]
MLRFIYVIVINIFRIFYYVPKMSYYAKHPEKYSEEERYALAQKVVKIVVRTSRVETEYEGRENLPKTGGYIMFSNHQGRYDPMGIIAGHERPCSFLIDKRRADQFLGKQFSALLDGISIDKESVKDQMRAMRALANGAKEGRIYLVFPEGIYYKDQGNRTGEFKQGCFICATHAKCPVVPVTVVDSYKVYGKNSLKRVKTKVIFHDPIYYEQYKEMNVRELSEHVKKIIDTELSKYEK